MKRSPMPSRRNPMPRASMRQSAALGLGRKPLRQRSKAAVDDTVRQASVRAEVFARDGHRCTMGPYARTIFEWIDNGVVRAIVIPGCGDGLVFAHRRKASAGGAYIPANGTACCPLHNNFHESEPDGVRALGGTRWIVREGDPEWDSLGRKANGVR